MLVQRPLLSCLWEASAKLIDCCRSQFIFVFGEPGTKAKRNRGVFENHAQESKMGPENVYIVGGPPYVILWYIWLFLFLPHTTIRPRNQHDLYILVQFDVHVGPLFAKNGRQQTFGLGLTRGG